MDIKKIYSGDEALVSDALIDSADTAINAAIPSSRAGMIIYTAGYKKVKQKSLDNKWITMQLGGSSGSGAAGKDGITPLLQKSATAIQVSYDSGDTYSDLVALSELKGAKGDAGAKGDKGETGAAGKDGTNGTNGKDGKSVTAIALTTDAEGNVTGGTVTFSDSTTAPITVTVAAE